MCHYCGCRHVPLIRDYIAEHEEVTELGGRALRALGHDDVRAVRVGKVIDLVVDAADADEARRRAERMCEELLANPVIERWQTEVVEVP